MTATMTTARLEQPAWALLRQAIGPARGVPRKVRGLGRVARGYVDRRVLSTRLETLLRAGVIDVVPDRWQLVAGSIDMLRFWISPAAADYYEQRGIHYGFHQLLRFLEEPASLTDPVGFFSERDGIIGHLMQVVHANPVYDLQLLCMFDDGLDQLERQLETMLDGTHPRASAIAAIVEEPDYHRRLLDFVRAWRRDPSTPPMLRSNLASGAFDEAERTFGTLTTAMRYFSRLPSSAAGAIRHVATVKRLSDSPARL
jgi:hypothetical protein